MSDKSPTELNKKRIAAIKLRDKCEKDIKDITRKMSEHIRISIIGENLLSEYKWELSTAGGYGGMVTFYTIIPNGDEWKLMDLIPADEFDSSYSLIDDAVELTKRNSSRNCKSIVNIHLYLNSAVYWVEKLGLKIHGDFDKLINERCVYADKYADEAATFRMLKRMVDD
jgi:hypothetical protein